MIISEVAMMSLALSLSVNPSDSDIQAFHSLKPTDKFRIQKMVEQRDALPLEIERLKLQALVNDTDGSSHAPTRETITLNESEE